MVLAEPLGNCTATKISSICQRVIVGDAQVLWYGGSGRLVAFELDQGSQVEALDRNTWLSVGGDLNELRKGCIGGGVDVALVAKSAPETEPRLVRVLAWSGSRAQRSQKTGDVRGRTVGVSEL